MAETLKEFLVSLGWQTNEAQQRKFVDAIEVATLRAKLLGDALEEVARKAASMVTGVADTFDKLYFAAQRADTSVKFITNFSYAVGQLGGNAAAAQGTLEAFGKLLRENPANIVYLNNIGFGLNKITGQLELQRDLVRNFQAQPAFIQERELALANADTLTGLALRKKELLDDLNQSADFQRRLGFDPDRAAEDSNKFMTTWRRVAMELSSIWDAFSTKLEAALIGPFQEFEKFIDKNGEDIGKAIDVVTDAIGRMTSAWVDDFEKIIKDPKSMDSFQQTMHRLAETIADMSKHFGKFISDLKWLNDELNSGANVLNRLLGLPLVGGGGSGSSVDNSEIIKSLNDKSGINGPPADDSIGGWANSGWNWVKRKLGYGDQSSSGASGDHVASSGSAGGRGNKFFTKENADAVRSAAAELGTTPEDLATVIGYETAGKFDPSIVGGKGNNYQGLIQFGPNERNKYGVTGKESFPEQMKQVTSFLKDRGFKPGMGLMDLYSTINAGSPGHYGASDGNGTVASHVANMQNGTAPLARKFLNSGADDGNGTVVFGDSIGQGVMGALHAGGSAQVGKGADWITGQINGYEGSLAGKRIILSSGASNSHDPQKVAAQINALIAKGVNPRDITVLGVGNRADFAGFNDTLKKTAEGLGASFSPIGNTPGGVHPDDYNRVGHDALAARPALPNIPTLRAPTNPYGGLSPFVSPGPLGAGVSQGDVTHINAPQHTEIHIDGTGDPTAVAHMVGANQNRVAADMSRNLQGATN